MAEKPKMPAGFNTRAKRLWRDVLASWELRPDDVVVLVEACRAMTVLDRLHAEMNGQPVMVTGSRGQPRRNPLLEEARAQQTVLARLLSQLAIPDDPRGARAGSRSADGRALVGHRWRRGAAT